MDKKQSESDEQDNRRVGRWGVMAFIILVLSALAYYAFVEVRSDKPVGQGATPSMRILAYVAPVVPSEISPP